MNIIRVGVDIAKSVFHVHGVDRHGQTQWQGKYSRTKWLDALSRKVPAGAEIGMEARDLQKRGFRSVQEELPLKIARVTPNYGVVWLEWAKVSYIVSEVTA